MIAIPSKYAELILGLDFVILITSLLFRKPKPKHEISTLDRKSLKLLGSYLSTSAIVLLILNHFAYFMSYLDYFTGLALDTFLFYLGLRVVIQNG